MARTAQLGLPLIAPAQAQKHVTVNEAIVRLDAATQLRVASSSVSLPPPSPVEGNSYLVPNGASGEWRGNGGGIAVSCNGGWIYLSPKRGWRVWDESRSSNLTFDGVNWLADAVVVSEHGSATALRIIEIDHLVTPGATNQIIGAVPAGAMVFGVTGRVIVELQGAGLASWRLGVVGSDNRYGSGLGKSVNSIVNGMSSAPVSYYNAATLWLSGEGGAFESGSVRLSIHLLDLVPPRSA